MAHEAKDIFDFPGIKVTSSLVPSYLEKRFIYAAVLGIQNFKRN